MTSTAKRPIMPVPTEQLDKADKPQIRISGIAAKILIAVMYICQFLLLFDRTSFELIIGPIMALCSVLLAFTDFYFIPFSLALFTPHAMGTVFMYRLSFCVFTSAVLIVRLFVKNFRFSFNMKDIMWLGLMLFNILHLYIFMFDKVGPEKMTFMLVFTAWVFFLKSEVRKNRSILYDILLSFAFAVVVDALASILSGTATKYSGFDRMGLLGIGSNDPNIAAWYITLAIAILISDARLNIWIRVGSLLLLGFSLIRTVSISGFIGTALVILTFALIMNKNRHNVSVLILLIICVLLTLYLFPMLDISQSTVTGINGETEKVNYLEYYQDKLYDKFDNLSDNKIDVATSGRTEISRLNVEYFFGRPAINQLFGGNDVNPLDINVSHNTFIDILLRFGLIGLFAVALMVIYSFVKSFQITRETKNCTFLLCKLAMLYWSLSLSIFEGNGAVIWIVLMLMF